MTASPTAGAGSVCKETEAEVTSPNTLTSGLISFCHGGAQLWNMHNKTIIGFGFHVIVIIIKASVCVFSPQPSASADNTNFGLDNYRYHGKTESNNCELAKLRARGAL